MQVGLLLEEGEPVQAGEEDDGEEGVGQTAAGSDDQLGQGPWVHGQLAGPPGPRPGLHGGPNDCEAGQFLPQTTLQSLLGLTKCRDDDTTYLYVVSLLQHLNPCHLEA